MSKFLLDKLLTFILIRYHVIFKHRVFHFWQTKFSFYEELIGSPILSLTVAVP